jgi:hypothetical protein
LYLLQKWHYSQGCSESASVSASESASAVTDCAKTDSDTDSDTDTDPNQKLKIFIVTRAPQARKELFRKTAPR